MKFHTKYIQEDNAHIVQGKLLDGSPALQVFSDIGEPLARVTVCLHAYGLKPAPGNVFVYGDYGEHEGVHHALQLAGVVGEVERTISIGGHDAEAFECRLLLDNELETR